MSAMDLAVIRERMREQPEGARGVALPPLRVMPQPTSLMSLPRLRVVPPTLRVLPQIFVPAVGATPRVSTMSLFWDLVRVPPEVVELCEALLAYEAGREEVFWSWAERFVGQAPDRTLREVFERHYLPHGGELPVDLVYGSLRYHKQRLESTDPAEWYEKQARLVEERLRKDEGYDLMQALKVDYGEPRGERLAGLRAEILAVLPVAEAEGFYMGLPIFEHTVHRVERIIINDLRPDLYRSEGGRAGTQARKEAEAAQKRLDAAANKQEYVAASRNLLIAKEHQAQAREAFLATYARTSPEVTERQRREDERLIDDLAARANLTDRRSELLSLRRQGYAIKKIADMLNIAEGTAKRHSKDTLNALKRAAGQ